MSKTEKSIDGLVMHRANSSARTVGIQDKPKKKVVSQKTKPTKTAVKKASGDNIPVKRKTVPKKVEKLEISEKSTEEFLQPVGTLDFDLTTEDLKEEKKRSRDEKKEKKMAKKEKKKKSGKVRRVLSIIALSIVSILIIGVVWVMIWGNSIIDRITGGRSNIWSVFTMLDTETYEPFKTGTNGRTNILAFGTSGYNMAGDEGKGKHAGAQLTDSILVISLDQKTGDVAMVSLPRDLKAGSTCTATGKINEVFWCNNKSGTNEEAGAQALMSKVGGILGIDFQYYAHVNWGSLISIVNSLGGITVTLDEDVNDRYYTKAVIKAGVPTTLNGEQALGLARARHGTSLGDFSRGNSQQKILMAIVEKVLSSNLGITDMINLVNILGDNLRSNFNMEDIKTGMHVLKSVNMNEMRQVSLLDWSSGITYMTTANINGISYVIPRAGVDNYGAIQAYIAKMFNNDPRVRDDAVIVVLNGSGEQGVAKAEKESLEKAGFKISSVGDVPEGGSYPDNYYFYALNSKKYGTQKLLEDRYGDARPASEVPANIKTAGYDFLIIVGTGESDIENGSKEFETDKEKIEGSEAIPSE